MRITKMTVSLFILSFFVISLFAEDELVFHYAFIVKTGNDTVRLLDTSGTHTKIDEDSRVRILLKPLSNAYLYLFLHDAQGNLTVLFPEQYDGLFTGDTYLNTLYRIPGPSSWLVPNGKDGTESFYLLVSNERLVSLESRVESYLRVQATDAAKKKKTLDEILAEITTVRRERSSFSEKAVSPVVIAGDYRGADVKGSLQANMVEVRAEKFYAKTIRLLH